MRIGIDARLYGPKNRGLGRYVQKLIENLEKLDSENEYIIFLRKENFEEYQPNNFFNCHSERSEESISANRIDFALHSAPPHCIQDGKKTERIRFEKVLADCKWYTLKEQFLMPYLIYKEKVDLMHFPHFNVPLFYFGKFVVTIHDLILFAHPEKRIRVSTLGPIRYFVKEFLAKLLIKSAAQRAKKIITVSNKSKQDIIRYLKANPENIEVIYLGVEDKNSIIDKNCKLPPFGRSPVGKKIENYLLYVGSAYPHKNLERLLEAFRLVVETQCLASQKLEQEGKTHSNASLQIKSRLILVGGNDCFWQKIKNKIIEMSLDDSVQILTEVNDEQLSNLYNKASLFVWPSLYEGFGLPPIEAMARGIPVISSNADPMPEILGNAALYFNAQDINDMVNAITKGLNNENLRQELIQKGFEHVKKYNWQECAKKTMEVYNLPAGRQES